MQSTSTNDIQDVYRPHDYTQDQINQGQRQINFAITQVEKRLVDVLTIMKDALQAPPGQAKTYVDQISKAIDAATTAINHVASIRPPGCDECWKPPSPVNELDANGWPVNFFERVAGSMPDLQRASQGEFEERRPF